MATMTVLDLQPPQGQAQRLLAAQWSTETPQEAARSAADDGRLPQASFLVVVPIPGEAEEGELSAIFQKIDADDYDTNAIIPFLKLRTIHFARFVLYRAQRRRGITGDEASPGLLLFATDYDGSLDRHLDELVREVHPGLHEIFRRCDGYPVTAHRSPEAFKAYLKENQLRSNTFYSGTRGRSVLQIRREADLREWIERFLDANPDDPVLSSGDPVAIRHWIVEHVQEALPWATRPPEGYPRAVPRVAVLIAAVVAIVGSLAASWRLFGGLATLGLTIGLAVVAASAALYLRHLEKTDDDQPLSPDLKDHTSILAAREDEIVQNQMTSVQRIKGGWFRLALLRTVLFVINAFARWTYVEGTLAGIPSIHFARWVILDEGRTLLFFSNFDGSWENYLGDFIDKASDGLTAVWSNCLGFPRTRWLTQDGARNELRFKQYTRESQITTDAWYSAYKDLTVDNINANSRIRLGLYGDMTGEEATQWLRRF